MDKVENQRQEIARILGEEKVNLGYAGWDRLLKEGVIVQIHVKRWRAKTALTWKDLGITFETEQEKNKANKLFKLGQIKLLPDRYLKQFDKIEVKARQSLEKYSLNVHWGYFVPAKSYMLWKTEFNEFKQEYLAIAQSIHENYDTIKDGIIDSIMAEYAKAYNRLCVLSPQLAENQSKDKFIDDVFTKIKIAYSHLEINRKGFKNTIGFDYELTYIPLLADMTEDVERAKQLEMETELLRDDVSYKRELMEEMHRDVVQKSKEQYENLIDTFLVETSKQVREIIYNASIDVLNAIKNNGAIKGRSILQLKNAISKVKLLQFTEDVELDSLMNKIESFIIDIPANSRDIDSIEQNLKDISIVLKSSMLLLGKDELRQDRLKKEEDINFPSIPSDELVRQSRDNLNLDTLIEINKTYRQQRLIMPSEEKSENFKDEEELALNVFAPSWLD